MMGGRGGPAGTFRWLKAAGLLWLLGPLSAPTAAQPSISLGEATAQPLQEAPLRLRIAGLEGRSFVRLRLRVQFPPRQLGFDRIEVDESNPRLRVTPGLEEVLEPGDLAVLSLDIEAPESIPPGELLRVVFRTTDEIYEAEELPVRILEASLTTAGGDRATDLILENGRVAVSIPVFACFFYLH